MRKIEQFNININRDHDSLFELSSLLGKSGINILSIMAVENKVKIIVDKPEETRELLKKENVQNEIEIVLLIEMPNTSGVIADIFEVLAKEKTIIDFVYSVTLKGQAVAFVIIGVSDPDSALQLLS